MATRIRATGKTVYGPSIIRDGLVLYLDAANTKSYSGTGTTWNDLSGNNNHATIQDAPTFTTTNNGTFNFNGSSNYINIPSSTSLSTTTPSFIIGCSTGNGTVFAKGMYGVYWNYGLTLVGNTTFRARNDFGDAVSPAFSSQSGFNIYSCVWTGTQINFYRNGVFGGSTTSQYSPNSLNLHFITIGCAERTGSPVTRSEFYNGSISFLQVYNRTLSAAEILQNYNATKSRFGL